MIYMVCSSRKVAVVEWAEYILRNREDIEAVSKYTLEIKMKNGYTLKYIADDYKDNTPSTFISIDDFVFQ